MKLFKRVFRITVKRNNYLAAYGSSESLYSGNRVSEQSGNSQGNGYKKGESEMSVGNIGASGYAMTAYYAKKAEKDAAGDFTRKMSEKEQADKASHVYALHGDDKETGDEAVTSRVDYINGMSMAVYRTKDFDPANPVYKVKTWDEAGNITERMIDISKVDPANCDSTEMYAYTAHLNVTGKGDFRETVLNYAVARAAKDLDSKTSGGINLSQKVNWMNIVGDIMESCYAYGDLKGYMKWKKFLGLLEEAKGGKISDVNTERTSYNNIRDRRAQAFDGIGAHAPECVKQAWLDAADKVGVDGMGISASGKLSHISQFMAQQATRQLRGEDSSNLLGSSVQSAIQAADKALYALEHPRSEGHPKTAQQLQDKEKEKQFYREFIKRLRML